MKRKYLLSVILIMSFLQPALAQENEQLGRVQKDLEEATEAQSALSKQAEQIQGELSDLQKKLVEAAAKAQEAEKSLSGIEDELDKLSEEEALKEKELEKRKKDMSLSLGAMVRMSQTPPEIVAVMPGEEKDRILASKVLKGVTVNLQEEAEAIKLDIMEIETLRGAIAERKHKLAEQKELLEKTRSQLQAMVDEKMSLRKSITRDLEVSQRSIDDLSRKAEDIRDLIAKIEAREADEEKRTSRKASERNEYAAREDKAEEQPVHPDKPITLRLPVAGKITSRFGATLAGGATGKGIRIATREGAQVVAPANGEVVFTGPFLGYGKILIVRHDGGYHSLVAGLKSINCATGDRVVGGEPVGVMGRSSEKLTELYFELRYNNRPLDPMNASRKTES